MSDRTPRATDTNGLLLGDFTPGTRVGEYIVAGRLATRGTGHVYEATHVVLPRRVIIKVMPAAQEWVMEIALELLREACVIDALDHPGIPRVYECGTLADRRPWIATELVEGPSLATIIEGRSLGALDAAAIVRDVAMVLDYAHGRGLVHSNVMPASIIVPDVTRRFPICLVDWSGARMHDSTTPLPMVPALSTRPYAAPELRIGDVVDSSADIYSLGIVARELLRLACPGSAPPVFTALVRRMLASTPADRPTAEEVVDHAGWLTQEIEPEVAIPHLIDDESTEPMRPGVPRVITSEVSSSVSGEIARK
jgi:serine/threonine-protein kinase